MSLEATVQPEVIPYEEKHRIAKLRESNASFEFEHSLNVKASLKAASKTALGLSLCYIGAKTALYQLGITEETGFEKTFSELPTPERISLIVGAAGVGLKALQFAHHYLSVKPSEEAYHSAARALNVLKINGQ
ncbi:hypothetical protein HOF78_04095 [Candidatus Woesearchaeota archaeon]|nr:hypothetical protein [Candidatus Woesearchaeota archaeon]MBT6023475.1 hypothetical protein [Candidatus Woesearchaeota archaeon]MBT6044457.1 hypothetical protein [Candidatus Woesearchaeota archaeon]